MRESIAHISFYVAATAFTQLQPRPTCLKVTICQSRNRHYQIPISLKWQLSITPPIFNPTGW